MPEALARSVVSLDVLYSALDIIEVARQTQLAVGHVGGIYFSLRHRLEMNWLRESIAELPVANHWQYRAQASLMDGLYAHGRALTADVIGATEADAAPEERLDAWLGRNKAAVDRCLGIFSDLRASGQPDLAMLSVALQAVGNLAQGGA